MTPGYAVTAEKDDAPAAVFVSREDALSWATLRFGPGAFQIAPVITQVAPPPPRARPPG
jgi:hypothetical protein